MRVLGARPDELRRLAAVLRRAADELAWLRRRIDVAQARSPAGRADTRSLLRLQAWLDDNAVDVRRRAARLEEAGGRRSWLGDFHPIGLGGGRCGSVLVPVTARRADGRGGDEGLGEPLFAAAPLRCAPGHATSDDDATVLVAVPGGAVLAKRPKRPGGTGEGGGGGGGGVDRPSKRGRIKKAMLPLQGIRYIPRKTWEATAPLPWDREKQGYVDRFKNVWTKGPSRTPGQPFEWDIQVRPKSRLAKLSKDGEHLNVDLDGRITH